MNRTDIFPARLRQTQAELAGAVEAWFENVKAQLRLLQITAGGRVEPRGTLGKSYRLTKGLTEANVKYVQDVALASLAFLGGSKRSLARTAEAAKDAGVSVAKGTAGDSDRFEQDAAAAMTELHRSQRTDARRAKRGARDAAAERYGDMTKTELSEELGDRGLKKSGKVDDLRERLMNDDFADA